MSNNIHCGLKAAHYPEQDSKLNKELNELFPTSKNTSKDSYGLNSHYIKLRTDPSWLEWFGNWPDSKAIEPIKKEAATIGVLNEQDEPALHKDPFGNVYVKNIHGDWRYLTGTNEWVSPEEFNDLVNTLTGDYIIDKGVRLPQYIKERFEEELAYARELRKDLSTKQRNYIFSGNTAGVAMTKPMLTNATKKVQMLTQITQDSNFQDVISKRVLARLEKLNYKYKETVADKEDNMKNVNDFQNFILESNQTSNRAINDPEVLQFMSSIPEFSGYEADIDQQMKNHAVSNYYLNHGSRKTKGGTQDSYKYMNQSAAWRLLEETLSDVIPDDVNQDAMSKDVFENFKLKLGQVLEQTQHPALNYIYNFLDTIEKNDSVADPESFKTKFTSAFYMARQNFLITQVEHEYKSAGEYDLKFNIVDPAQKSNSVARITNEFINTITHNPFLRPVKGDEESGSDKNVNKNVATIKARLKKAFKEVDGKNDFESYVLLVDEMFNNILGLDVSKNVLKYYVRKEITTPDGIYVSPFKQKINSLIDTLVQSSVVAEVPGPAANGDIELFRALLWTGKSRLSSEHRDAIMKHLTRKDSIFTGLAQAANIFSKEGSETSVILAGGKRWGFSYMSGIHKQIIKWKQGQDPLLENFEKRGFKLAKHLLDPHTDLDSVKVFTNSEIKKKRDNTPTPHKKITEIDAFLDAYVKMFDSKNNIHKETTDKKAGTEGGFLRKAKEFKNYLLFNFGADKNSIYSIFGLPNIINQLSDPYNAKSGQMNPSLKELIKGYVQGELTMAVEAGDTIREYLKIKNEKQKRKYLMENLIPGYHYKLDKKNPTNIEKEPLTAADFNRGTYNSIGIFSAPLNEYLESSDENSARVFDQVSDGLGSKPTIKLMRPSFVSPESKLLRTVGIDTMMGKVYNQMNAAIKKDYEYLKNITLVKRKDGDKEIQRGLFEVNNNIENGDVDNIIYEYVIGSFLVGYELSNMLTGHISFYKQGDPKKIDIADYLKRAPAIATDGLYLRHRNTGKSKTYTTYSGEVKTIQDKDDAVVVAVVNDIVINSSKHKDLIQKATSENLTLKHELADAQGIMTPEHFKDIIARIYGWENIDDQMFKELMNPKHKITDENIQWIRKKSKSLTPLKMVYFGVRPSENDAPDFPVYLKYSLAPLFPAITSGTQMEKLLKQMEKQGVEQVVFKSGSKASNFSQTTIHKMDGELYDGLADDLKFNPFTLDADNLKMQVQMPTKMDKQTLLGMQAFKNILTNLNMDKEAYTLPGETEPVSGERIYDEINSVAKDILQHGLDQVLNEIGYDENAENGNKFDVGKVKKLLLKQMDIETEQDLIAMLKTDLPLDTVPNFAQRAFPVISSYVKDKAGKIYTNGGSMVQVANIAFDRIINPKATSIFFFDKNNTELQPPLPETNENGEIVYYNKQGEFNTEKGWREELKGTDKKFNKDDYKMHIKKAKILMPFSSIFAKTGLSYEEFQELYKANKIDKKLFSTILGYRIPNQAMSSNDSFEIVGILPPVAGDQAVVYHEITAKTGSDFDIDKMYLAMPNFDVKYKNEPSIRKKLKDSGLTKKIAENILKKEGVYDDTYYTTVKAEDKDPIMDLFFHLKAHEGALDSQLEDKLKEIVKKKHELDSVTYSTEGIKGKQNRLIELLISVLESQESYADLMAELDSDIIKDTINKMVYMKTLDTDELKAFNKKTEEEQIKESSEYIESNKINAMEQMFPVNLTNSRMSVMEAKTLVAIMANNMTDIGESQKVNFGLKYPLGFKTKDGTRAQTFARIHQLGMEGKEEGKLSKIISYFMNSAVDAAKDSYITSGNVNSYSANGVLMMARLGLNLQDLFTITMNEEIVNFSKFKTHQKSKAADLNFTVPQRELDEWSNKLLHEMAAHDFDLWSVVSREDFITNNPAKKKEILGFWNLIQTMGKEFNNSVVAMKSESNGAGQNLPEMISLINRLKRVKMDSVTNAFKKWTKDGKFDLKFRKDVSKDKNVKVLGAMANNTLLLMKELSEEIFIEAKPSTVESMNQMMAALGSPLETNVDMIKLMYDYIYPYLLHKSNNELYHMNDTRQEHLLEEFPSTLKRFKDTHKNNRFLEQLTIETGGEQNLISFPSFKTFSQEDRSQFKQDIVNIMHETKEYDKLPEDHPNREYINLVKDLVGYAFLTSGFRSTYYSFNDMIPASFFINNAKARDIKEDIDPRDALTFMAQVNHSNYKIAKNISKNLFNNKRYPSGEEVIIDSEETGVLERIELNKGVFSPFIKFKKKLLMYKGTVDGDPVYTVIPTFDADKFKIYGFHNAEPGLNFNANNTYESEVAKLYKNVSNLALNPNVTENNSEIDC